MIIAVNRSRSLRKNPTEAEKLLWLHLRDRRLLDQKFYRQYSIPPYYVDFICRGPKLIVEVDGGQHCESEYDERRSKFLEANGYTVLRFWNNEVLGNIEGVLSVIIEKLRPLTLALSLKGEGEERLSS